MVKVLFEEDGNKAIELMNKNGLRVIVTDFGASIFSVEMMDKNGTYDEITLTTDTIHEFKENGCFWGATVGRVANRIGKARFVLNGKEYNITKNDGENCLHGGIEGFHLRTWDTAIEGDTVIFTLVSPDGDQGFPGELKAEVKYYFDEEDRLVTESTVTANEDTPCCLSNHTYFNLGGHASGTILDHELQIEADYYLETDSAAITTGQILKNNPNNDFSKNRVIGNNYDVLYALRERGFKKCATVHDPASGRMMTVYSDYPCLCFYNGGALGGNKGKNGSVYCKNSAVVLEPKYFPNAVNYAHFGEIILKKGTVMNHKIAYEFAIK